eukprot:TRINITY_DN61990_c0_g1_i1.p1 TRINITY_DN61990_c0_g1~~TRINITY_DN61990_c0_g1_i1.p1  ORF type:complete len:649 (-),score=121.08 TRINITY_DN61990_c0_g1_i1:48-1994(-)
MLALHEPKRRRLGNDKREDLAHSLLSASSAGACWELLAESAERLTSEEAVAALERLPALLAAEAVSSVTAPKKGHVVNSNTANLNNRLKVGLSVDAPPLPSCRRVTGQKEIGDEFLWVHDRIEEVLDDDLARVAVSESWLATTAIFYGTLRPGPPLPKHVLEECADEALRRLQAADGKIGDLPSMCRIALGCACSGILRRHGIYAAVAAGITDFVTQVFPQTQSLGSGLLDGLPSAHHKPLTWPFWWSIHDCVLALAFVRPWDAESAQIAEDLQCAMMRPFLQGSPHVPRFARPAPKVAGATRAGARGVDAKENQDAFLALGCTGGFVACLAAVDGHGAHGAAVAGDVRKHLNDVLSSIGSESAVANELAQAFVSADIRLLLNKDVDSELSGASCAVVLVETIPCGFSLDDGVGQWLLTIGHLGDCRAVLGFQEDLVDVKVRLNPVGSDLKAIAAAQLKQSVKQRYEMSLMRLTADHRPGDTEEALRIISAGGRIQRIGHGGGRGNDLGPPRLWSRLSGLAPGLAMSRGLGDVLGQSAGLSVEASIAQVQITRKDSNSCTSSSESDMELRRVGGSRSGGGDGTLAVIVVASDGIFDMLSDREVLDVCWPAASAGDAAAAADAVLLAATRAWDARGPYRDDATCVVLVL